MGKQSRRKGRRQQTPAPQQQVKPNSAPGTPPAVGGSPPRRFVGRLSVLLRGLLTPFGLVSSIATIVATVVALGYLHGTLIVSIGENAPLNEDRPTYFFFSMPENAEYSRYVLPVNLKLTNASNFHDDEVRMIVSYDRKYGRTELPEEAWRPDARRPAGEQRREVSSDGKNDYVKFSATFLPPKHTQPFTDAAIATQIPRDPQDPLLFNSGVGLDVDVSTYSKGDTDRNWTIRYRGLRARNDAEITQIMVEFYTQQLAYEIRRKSGFWEYLPKAIAERFPILQKFQKPVMMYGYSPVFRFAAAKNVFVPVADPEQTTGYRVWPYSWDLLFHFSEGESLFPWAR